MAKTANVPPGRLWIVPGARHNEARAVDQEGYDDRVMRFLASTPSACEGFARGEPASPAEDVAGSPVVSPTGA